MQRIASQIILRVNLLFLSLLPGFALAGNSAPEDYLASTPLVLEVRYCECEATLTDSVPSELLPGFLKESSLLKIGVSGEDKGFVSSNGVAIGYELKPVVGSPDRFHFNYAGNYTTSNGNSAGNGTLLLIQGQWVSLFGAWHENEAGSQHSHVVMRLVKPDGRL